MRCSHPHANFVPLHVLTFALIFGLSACLTSPFNARHINQVRNTISEKSITHFSRCASQTSCYSKYSDTDEIYRRENTISSEGTTRRRALQSFLGEIVTLATVSALPFGYIANAACLSGDTSTECIGIYKVPIDSEILPFVETPEKLEKYAPGIKWVPPVSYPKSYQEAVEELRTQRIRWEKVKDFVLEGKLEEAGKELLYIIPRVTVAGSVVTRMLEAYSGTTDSEKDKLEGGGNLSMRSFRTLAAYESLLVKFGQCDVEMGQGLRGELGVSAAAQILILSSIEEATADFDDLIKAIPDNFHPNK